MHFEYIILISNILNTLKQTSNLISIFGQITDPRSHINQLHNLEDILLIGIISVICGAETWEQMVQFSKSKEAFLRTFLELPNGIPSKDTINRVFSSIDSEQFESCFVNWVSSIAKLSQGQIIAIDGKTIRGAKSAGKTSPVHMVSAWACENNMVLGQVKTNEKSNEITAIPELLKILDIEGNTITIDAMGTQKNIAKTIINDNADYILAVKGNQPQLLAHIQDEFRFAKDSKPHIHEDLGHGRIETRICCVIDDFQFIEKDNGWENLKSILKIESIREFKNRNKPIEKATRYYISSLQNSPKEFQAKVRSHWAIENKLHWTLDVAFSEDASRKRAGNAPQNYSTLLKIALNLLKNEKSKKASVKTKRLEAAWNEEYILKILQIKV